MIGEHEAFSGFAVQDLKAAGEFYGGVLGLTVTPQDTGPLARLEVGGGRHVLMYEQPEMTPASYTFLNFPVADVGAEVRQLRERGVEFLRYDGCPQDEDGVMRGYGPDIAWFADPSGNVCSVIAAD